MSILKIIGRYLKNRIKSKLATFMRSVGSLLTVWTIAIFASLIALVMGQDPNWGVSLAIGLGGTSKFLVDTYRMIFGKPKDGNGSENGIEKDLEKAKQDVASEEPPS